MTKILTEFHVRLLFMIIDLCISPELKMRRTIFRFYVSLENMRLCTFSFNFKLILRTVPLDLVELLIPLVLETNLQI